MKQQQRLVVIGGGAAGFFGAIKAAESAKGKLEVIILEKSNKTLSKVRISGGGRCNVTNACEEARILSQNYPRGQKKLVQAFRQFGTKETKNWFTKRGVMLKSEADGRVFPASNSSQTIIDLFNHEIDRLNIKVQLGCSIKDIRPTHSKIVLYYNDVKIETDYLLLASGGHPKSTGYSYLNTLELTIEPPVPSLFTFNIKNPDLHKLAGVAVDNAEVLLGGTKFTYSGPLLITHWGLSGPAVLKNSAFGARHLYDVNYTNDLLVNWSNVSGEQEILALLKSYAVDHPKRQIGNYPLYGLPQRLWYYLLNRIQITEDAIWGNFGAKQFNRLKEVLYRDRYKIEGKTTFKEEFVTCGGISISEVNLKKFELKKHPGIYVAGELLDVDGITGGFNFQAAWTTAYIAASDIANKVNIKYQ